MATSLVAALLTLAFTAVLTIAGLGAAFILIPIFVGLGIDIHTAMATALLLNSIAMAVASVRFIRAKLVRWNVAVPILFTATALSPLGARASDGLERDVLLWGFVGFLVFAGLMMLFYRPTAKSDQASKFSLIALGAAVGGVAGFVGGLLGVGGGNMIVPLLVWLGIDPKKASATTSFIVVFSSMSGFLAHANMGNIDSELVGLTGAAAVIGALVGSWLMTEKLKRSHVKVIVGVVLLAIATKILAGLLGVGS